jgi:hypothetical protein
MTSRQLQKLPAPVACSARPRSARWKAWPWAETSPGRIARPWSRTRSAPSGGGPTAATTPSRTVSAAPARTAPPETRRSGRYARAACIASAPGGA